MPPNEPGPTRDCYYHVVSLHAPKESVKLTARAHTVLVQSFLEGNAGQVTSRGSLYAAMTAAQIAGMFAGRPGSFPILN